MIKVRHLMDLAMHSLRDLDVEGSQDSLKANKKQTTWIYQSHLKMEQRHFIWQRQLTKMKYKKASHKL